MLYHLHKIVSLYICNVLEKVDQLSGCKTCRRDYLERLCVCSRSTCIYVSTAHRGSSATLSGSSSLFQSTPLTRGSVFSSSPMTSTTCTSTLSGTVMRVRLSSCFFCGLQCICSTDSPDINIGGRWTVLPSAQHQFIPKAWVIRVATNNCLLFVTNIHCRMCFAISAKVVLKQDTYHLETIMLVTFVPPQCGWHQLECFQLAGFATCSAIIILQCGCF